MSRLNGAPAQRGALARLWRFAAALLHLLRGLAITAFILSRADHHERNRRMQRWAQQFLDLSGVTMRVLGTPPPAERPAFLVGNHVSWLDILLVNAACPVLFVSKAEVRDWPLFGWLATRIGTLYIDRARRAETLRVNAQIAERLAVPGERVAVFPEGTTSDGSTLLPFHPSLIEPAVRAGAQVHPLAIRYLDAEGRRSAVPAYVGGMSLARSMWRIFGTPGLVAEIRFLPAVASAARHRREVAHEAQDLVAAALGVPVAHKSEAR